VTALIERDPAHLTSIITASAEAAPFDQAAWPSPFRDLFRTYANLKLDEFDSVRRIVNEMMGQ